MSVWGRQSGRQGRLVKQSRRSDRVEWADGTGYRERALRAQVGRSKQELDGVSVGRYGIARAGKADCMH